MRFRLQLMTISDDGSERIHLVAELARGCELRPETAGLTLAEGKQILKQVQQVVIDEQVQTCMAQHRQCAICGELLSHKGHHQIKLRTVFGKLQIRSPRLRRCPCSKGEGTKSFSPLARVLPERSTPERLYLETLFASLLSYGTTTKLLKELLPLEEQLNAMTIRDHLLAVAKRSEAELGTEQVSFIEGCPRDWAMICLRKRGQVLVNYCLDFADAREFQIRVETGSLVSCVVAWDYRRFRYNQRAWLGRGRDFWECDFGSTRF